MLQQNTIQISNVVSATISLYCDIILIITRYYFDILQYWVGVLKKTILFQAPGTFITIGSFANTQVNPETVTLLIFIAKWFFTTMMVIFQSVAVTAQKKYYKVSGRFCFKMNG